MYHSSSLYLPLSVFDSKNSDHSESQSENDPTKVRERYIFDPLKCWNYDHVIHMYAKSILIHLSFRTLFLNQFWCTRGPEKTGENWFLIHPKHVTKSPSDLWVDQNSSYLDHFQIQILIGLFWFRYHTNRNRLLHNSTLFSDISIF